MVRINKPKLWNYKSGNRKGKLRPKAKAYLSFKLKDFNKRKRIIEAQIQEEEPEKEIRTRQQVVFNNDYNMSLRAIGFNYKFTKKELTDRLNEVIIGNILENKYGGKTPFEDLNFDDEGYEDEEIDSDEDIGLNQNEITIELNVHGTITLLK